MQLGDTQQRLAAGGGRSGAAALAAGSNAAQRTAASAAAAARQRQRHPRRPRAGAVVRADAAETEVRVCTNKVCKKQGADQIVSFGQQLGLPGVRVTAGGCLGNCGAGPNLALLPQGQILRHVSTPADLAQVLTAFCGADVSPRLLRATELRLAGNALAMGGDLAGAVERYTAALAADPEGPAAYMIHSNLSATHLQLGDKAPALAAARAAAAGAPRSFHKAHVRLIDALWANGLFEEAAAAAEAAVAADAGFAALPEYKVIRQALADAKKKAVA